MQHAQRMGAQARGVTVWRQYRPRWRMVHPTSQRKVYRQPQSRLR